MIIKPENTSIKKGLSKSVKDNLDIIKGNVLDYGAGKLRNSLFLSEQEINLYATDLDVQVLKWDKKEKINFLFLDDLKKYKNFFDVVLLTFVLNVIVEEKERIEILKNIKEILKKDGILIVETRTLQSFRKRHKREKFKDGYVLKKQGFYTFQKIFEKEEIEKLILDHFLILESKKKKASNIILCKKVEKNKFKVKKIKDHLLFKKEFSCFGVIIKRINNI